VLLYIYVLQFIRVLMRSYQKRRTALLTPVHVSCTIPSTPPKMQFKKPTYFALPQPQGVTYRNQPLPDMPTDLLLASANHPQASAAQTMDMTTWVQPVGGTYVTLGDVQALMDIQSRQFHWSMMDNLNQMQAQRMAIATQELSSKDRYSTYNSTMCCNVHW
jgi:hypothetical protein